MRIKPNRFISPRGLIGCAALALSFAVSAATPAAQVYDVCLSLRTTAAATAKVNNKTNPFFGEDNETIVYRKPTNIEWRGLVWGCDCETVDGVWEEVNEFMGGIATVKGCILWDTQTKAPVFVGDGSDLTDVSSVPGTGFGWQFINAIGRGGDEVEGVWSMTQAGQACWDDGCQLYELQGSGFGRLRLNHDYDEVDCTSHILYMIGKVSGWMYAPSMSVSTDWSGCTFCGYDPGTTECEFATAWEWGAFSDSESWMDCDECRTAVHGTWTYRYNEELSKRLSTMVDPKLLEKTLIYSITQVYDFSELPAVTAAIEAIEAYMNDIDPTGCDEFEAALAKAKANTKECEAAVEATKYENLKAVEVAANALVIKQTATNEAAQSAHQFATEEYEIANAAYEKALYNQTNVNWEITYLNASRSEKVASGVGCVKLTAAIDELSIFDLVKMESSIPGLYGIRTCTSWAACTALVKEFTDATAAAKDDLVKVDAALISAKADLVTAAAALEVANDALAAAQNNLADITILQYEAARALEKAETAEAAAQKAYDDAGCND